MMLSALLALALAAPVPAPATCVEILSLSDLHGRVAELPRIAVEIAPVRARGPSLLLDAGDSAQGTVESTLSRGDAAVAGLAALGVNAAALGNHDLDFGQAEARKRIAAAPYPTLAANLRDAKTGRMPAWKNLEASRLFLLPGGPVVGVFGLATPSTPKQTMPANVEGLRFGKLAQEAERQARDLRARGAVLVIGLVHAGGNCRELGTPDDLSSCDPRSELFTLARALPPGLVDALVGGHTHGYLGHRVNGVALLQAGARGRGGRVAHPLPGRASPVPPAHPAGRRQGRGRGGRGSGGPRGGGTLSRQRRRRAAAARRRPARPLALPGARPRLAAGRDRRAGGPGGDGGGDRPGECRLPAGLAPGRRPAIRPASTRPCRSTTASPWRGCRGRN